MAHVATSQDVLTKVANLPPILKETSGLEITENGNLWTIIDSSMPVLYNINTTTGAINKVVHLNHKNNDWEDIAKDSEGNFYIGGFGNNKNDRRNLMIYKVPSPDSIKDKVINAELIHFHYSDQKQFPPKASKLNFDMEAMACFGNSIYLFSKNKTKPFTGYTKVYKLPNTPGDYEAQLMDSVFLGAENMYQSWVTAAAMSPDNKTLALLTSNRVILFSCFKDDKFFRGKMKTIELNNFSQKEGLCFINNTELYISDELAFDIVGRNLYHLKLDRNFGEACKQK